MKVVVIGTRGFPEVAGGVETHCCELYPRLAALGVEVIVLRRTPYATTDNEYRGVSFHNVYAPRGKYFETIVHTFLSVIKARKLNPDLLHVHAIGPALAVPFAKLLGMKVVMTHHGADYNRDKWGRLAKKMLRRGEKAGVRRSDAVIAVSDEIRQQVKKINPHVRCSMIPNGVNRVTPATCDQYVRALGLQPGRYALAMGRFVREKGFSHLIDAFQKASPDGIRLVIAGDSDFPDAYSKMLKAKGAAASVVMPGYIYGEELRQLMTHAALFVMPSSHEGHPIALLEAMSYGLDIIASDIKANRLDNLRPEDFYPVGDTDSLARKLQEKLRNGGHRTYDLSAYDWDSIAHRTLDIYQTVLTTDNHRNKT